jgi:lipoate-protein ligase A
MRRLDLTLPTAAENLALDEALLEEAETAGFPCETLRLWEPAAPLVVVGRSSQVEKEVRLDVCRELGIPVLRRASGGAAVLTGPGCLMYALVLSRALRGGLRAIDRVHRFVLGTISGALEPLVPGVRCQGISDLAVAGRKFSGNSVRCKREHLLYHGTLLYDFRLELIDRCLAMPPRQPAYRGARTHADFVTNLPVEAAVIRDALAGAWGALEPLVDWPRKRTMRLAAEKYHCRHWNENR